MSLHHLALRYPSTERKIIAASALVKMWGCFRAYVRLRARLEHLIQDPLDYGSRVHHSSLDTVDHMRADDMRQAAVIMARMLWQAANSDKELPRAVLPTLPAPTDPFKVRDPAQ
jgi:hypothetical protein